MTIHSPLSGSDDLKLLKSIKTSKLISDWKHFFQIDISNELDQYSEIYLYQCNKTKIQFFVPNNIFGSDKLYEQLEKFDWYYMPRKWEHEIALQDLSGCRKVLEVGCGRGAFVERMCKENKLEAQGIELNSNAVKYAQNRGIPVSSYDLYNFAEMEKHTFDAVCTFQVLEHVPNPKDFLEALTHLIKPGGKLIISVPNSESFPKYLENHLLDQPPHHMTRWCKETFECIAHILPIQLKRTEVEPLAKYHVSWYLDAHLSRFIKSPSIKRIAFQPLKLTIKPTLENFASIRNLFLGHTIYACFEKK